MKRFFFGLVFSVLAVAISFFDDPGHPTPTALAASGATSFAPLNYDLEAGPVQVGGGPTNYDFGSGGSGWSKIGNVTYTGGVAKLTGSSMLTSSYFTATSDVQSIKIRYKYPGSGSAQIAVYNSSGSAVGVDN